eukprot:635143-Rhodomonas_salina.1
MQWRQHTCVAAAQRKVSFSVAPGIHTQATARHISNTGCIQHSTSRVGRGGSWASERERPWEATVSEGVPVWWHARSSTRAPTGIV